MFCLFYFIYKIRRLISSSPIVVAGDNTGNNAIMEAHKRMKYITRKLMILVFAWNIFAGIAAVLGVVLGVYFARALEHFIVSLCMVLSFGFMDNAYRRICCICIYCCKNCCK